MNCEHTGKIDEMDERIKALERVVNPKCDCVALIRKQLKKIEEQREMIAERDTQIRFLNEQCRGFRQTLSEIKNLT